MYFLKYILFYIGNCIMLKVSGLPKNEFSNTIDLPGQRKC